MSIGRTLREARLSRKLTTSQIATATRMKVQMVEAIERDDFTLVTAPVYGKGFIRLYAENVGIDPRPLIADYASHFASAVKPSLIGEHPPAMIDETAAPDPAHAAPDPVPPRSGDGKPAAPEDELWKPLEDTAAKKDGWRPAFSVQETESNPFENRPVTMFLKYISIALGVLLLLIFIISFLSRLANKPATTPASRNSSSQTHEKLRVAVDPPAPYVR